ncbi:MAG TPA: peptidoglycan-associated lipoprotein Pal [Thermoanaerobaculia bacterium]|nr:peptidoglycan-associated lipoprotein Pal [Thermoanaerobaculia bacterium]
MPATNTVPDVATTVTRDETPVQQEPDFVQETKPTEEQLPRDLDQLNAYVQSRGLVRDAFFNYDEATLDADAQAALTATATWLRSNRAYNLLIEGHCDERGTEQYNLALGDRRANTAKEYLQTLGIDSSRLKTVSYGEERPFDEGHDDAAWGKNRRAHLVLVR